MCYSAGNGREVLMEIEKSLSRYMIIHELTLTDCYDATQSKEFSCHLLLGIRRNASMNIRCDGPVLSSTELGYPDGGRFVCQSHIV